MQLIEPQKFTHETLSRPESLKFREATWFAMIKRLQPLRNQAEYLFSRLLRESSQSIHYA